MKTVRKITAILLTGAILAFTGCSGSPETQGAPEITTSVREESTVNENQTTAAGTEEEISTEAPVTAYTVDATEETTEAETTAAAENTTSAENAATTSAESTTTVTEKTTEAVTEKTTAATEKTTEAQQPSDSGKTITINAESLPANVENIVTSMGAGWNLGNSMDAYSGDTSSETAWGNPKTTKELIKTVKAAGFKTIRIPVTYRGHIEDGTYEIEKAWLDRVNEIVDYVIDEGMYAIINIHHDGNNHNSAWLNCAAADQTEVRAKFRRIWEQLSERFKNYGDRLVFESMNEILEEGNYSTNISAEFYNNINELNKIFVDTVRASGGKNADRWLLIPGYNTNIDATAGDFGFVLPKDSAKQRLMVSVHYYDPYALCLDETKKVYKWGNDATKGGKPNWGHEDYVEQQMSKLYDVFTSKGIPVIIGEYGIIDKTYVSELSNTYRRYYLEYVAKSAVNHGCVPVYWDNGYDGKNGFALFNRKTNTVIYKELTDAIVRGATRETYAISIPMPE